MSRAAFVLVILFPISSFAQAPKQALPSPPSAPPAATQNFGETKKFMITTMKKTAEDTKLKRECMAPQVPIAMAKKCEEAKISILRDFERQEKIAHEGLKCLEKSDSMQVYQQCFQASIRTLMQPSPPKPK